VFASAKRPSLMLTLEKKSFVTLVPGRWRHDGPDSAVVVVDGGAVQGGADSNSLGARAFIGVEKEPFLFRQKNGF
jgi:hypothetical protein